MGADSDSASAPPQGVQLCVLASGSGGNCSVLAITRGGITRLCLIDLGLSPRRTSRLLAGLGLGLHQVDDAILTHLDSDHFCPTWARALPRHVRVHLHDNHAATLGLFGLGGLMPESFGCRLTLRDGTEVGCVIAPHDRAGVATLRFDLATEGSGGGLGFATDLGRATDPVVEHLRSVDVLAIESNYCPAMQEASDRPEELKRRIMGGAGHLSNHQAVEAIGRISPRRHVVLLHLSRQCNDPETVAGLHASSTLPVTITSQHRVTEWITIAGPRVEVRALPGRIAAPATG